MIGNDVIDLELAAADSDWRRSGFLEKLFSEAEKSQILQSKTPDMLVWKLWSQKEAAYKIFNRKTGIRAFNPLYFECRGEDVVRFGNEIVFCESDITPACIHTIACEKREYFSNLLSVEPSQITKPNGLPALLKSGKSYIATVSHHGKFVKCLALVGDRFDIDFAVEDAMHGTFLPNFD